MKNVELTWTPSASPGVDSQRARIVDVNTSEMYGEATLEPSANTFLAMCPEGTTVQGIVVTVRGEEAAGAASNELKVPFGPLAAATGLSLVMGPMATNPIA